MACGGDGYQGRTGVFEVAPLSAQAASLIARGADYSDIQIALTKVGARPIAADALRKAAEGITGIEEVTRLKGLLDG